MRNTPSLILAATAFVTLTACGPSQEELDAERSRVSDLQSELAQSKKAHDALDTKLSEMSTTNQKLAAQLRALGSNVEALEGDREKLSNELDTTQQALAELRQREEQAQARLATFRQLLSRFKSMIKDGRLRVRIVRNRMVVELPEGILFGSGSATLKRSGYATLGEVAQALASLEGRSFQVAGHTDNVPIRTKRFPSNWELSATRAVHVGQYLVNKGVPQARLSAAGYADTQPVASNDTKQGRQQNRRIEIVLLPNLDELPDLSSLATEAQN